MGRELSSRQYNYNLLLDYGEDLFISANVEIRRPHTLSVGSHTAIDTGFYCTVPGSIGHYVHIAPYVTIIGGEEGEFRLGDFCTIAAGSRIVCVGDEHLGHGLVGPTIPTPYRDKVVSGPVIMKDYSALATNVVVLQGVTLAQGSVVGACSLVTKDTEPWTIYHGVPAKAIKKRPRDRMMAFGEALIENTVF